MLSAAGSGTIDSADQDCAPSVDTLTPMPAKPVLMLKPAACALANVAVKLVGVAVLTITVSWVGRPRSMISAAPGTRLNGIVAGVTVAAPAPTGVGEVVSIRP